MTLRATDVSGQKTVKVKGVAPEFTVGELVHKLIDKMHLSRNKSTGQPVTYHALLPREGRHLQSLSRIGDVVKEDDLLVLQPSVDAG